MKIGTVSQVDAATSRVKIRFPELDVDTATEEAGLESGWLHVTQQWTGTNRSFSMPTLNEQVACMVDEHCASGVVLGGIYSEVDAVPSAGSKARFLDFEDGTSVGYDPDTRLFSGTIMGAMDVVVAGKAKITAMDGLELTGAGPVKLVGLDALTVEACGPLTINAQDTATINTHGTTTLNAFEPLAIQALKTVGVNATLAISLTSAASITLTAPLISLN